MDNILITGASGFIGSNLIHNLLLKEKKISILIRKKSNLWRLKNVLPKLEKYVIDFEDQKSLKSIIKKIEPDIVFHLATYGTYPFQNNLEEMSKTNIIGSVNLMNVCAGIGNLKRFVNFGSSFEYAFNKNGIQETNSINPISPYAITKSAQSSFGKYFNENSILPIVTIKPFTAYGPYESPGRLVSDIMTSIVKKKILKLSSPLPRRDFIYIDDLINAIKKSSKIKNIEGEIFNIGAGKAYSIKDIVLLASKITNKKIELSWGNKEKEHSIEKQYNNFANIKKAEKLLDWKPKYSIQTGLLKTYRWYMKNSLLYENLK